MENVKQCIIIGCGLTGPVMGMLLVKYKVFEAKDIIIFERAREEQLSSSLGASMCIASTGMSVLEEIGVAEQVANAGVAISRYCYQKCDGQQLGEYDIGYFKDRYGSMMYGVERHTLRQLLLESARSLGIKVLFNKSLERVEQENDSHVTATFSDGTKYQSQILIGADGIHSNVRKSLFKQQGGEQACLDYSGYSLIYGVAERKNEMDSTFHSSIALGKYMITYPCSPTHQCWVINKSEKEEKEQWKMMHQSDVERVFKENQEFQNTYFKDTITNTKRLFKVGIYHHPQDLLSQPWSLGRVVLIGDSAHSISPHLGQGLNLGLQDTKQLTIVLKQQQQQQVGVRDCSWTIESLGKAFKLYEIKRSFPTKMIINKSNQQIKDKISCTTDDFEKECLQTIKYWSNQNIETIQNDFDRRFGYSQQQK
ncbi:FAD dependent oxidoreductase domain-containing protein [Cavenderia fasciculata]|uniref:FAD dependent oxidoreductase domain-containing protein n=1 Tax=Cavenderia fasciculata TaxID=261658 RepID=F4PW51_CACFS|nr:FAD dependent oxidoreductase domain-containing protein [Cavenderia fasciculata]EGG20215.1 FAD dependent oxidoreductase domain-containing protein [Cavenderia fasciculata]|eukprot:XP_004367198.1 FAD dependent oxidoreductase domain-containing protein [Cavenderia fasciculata]